jgi:hypothetical protein
MFVPVREQILRRKIAVMSAISFYRINPQLRGMLTGIGALAIALLTGCESPGDALLGSVLLRAMSGSPAVTASQSLLLHGAADALATDATYRDGANTDPRANETSARDRARQVRRENGGHTEYSLTFVEWDDRDGDNSISLTELEGMGNMFDLAKVSQVTCMSYVTNRRGKTMRCVVQDENNVTVAEKSFPIDLTQQLCWVVLSAARLHEFGINGRCTVRWYLNERLHDSYSVAIRETVSVTDYPNLDEYFKKREEKWAREYQLLFPDSRYW